MPQLSGAQFLVEGLIQMKTRHVYGMIGTSIMGFFEGLYDYQDKIHYISCRHEQVAVSMADVEGRLTGTPGVSIVHAGAGALNSIISVANAYKDGSPLLFITGGVKSRLQGLDGWLEVDQKAIFTPLIKGFFRPQTVSEIAQALSAAYKLMMTGAKGPVVLEIPEELWKEKETVDLDTFDFSLPPPLAPDFQKIKDLAQVLAQAQKPLLLVGAGVAWSGAVTELKNFIEQFQLPVVTTGNARGVLSEKHPLNLGRMGFGGGTVAADTAFEQADVIVGLGTSFSDVATYDYTLTTQGQLYLINQDPRSADKPCPIEDLILGDAKEALGLLHHELERLGPTTPDQWLTQVAAFKQNWQQALDLAATMESPLSPSFVFNKLAALMPKDSIVTGGAGLHVVYANDYLPSTQPMGYLSSTNFGAMGFAFAAGLAAKLIRPQSCVMAVLGDGDFLMTVQDLETLMREKLGLKIIVVNDNSYRVLAVKQRIQFQNRVMGSLHTNPDLLMLAKSFGLKALRITEKSDVEIKLKEFFSTFDPVLLEIVTDAHDLPPTNLQAALRMGQV